MPPTHSVCSTTEGIRPICIDDFEQRVHDKLSATLSSFAKSKGLRGFKAKLGVVSLDNEVSKEGGVHVHLVLSWKLAVSDEKGGPVASPSGTTKGPTAFSRASEGSKAFDALVEALVGDVDKALKSAPPSGGEGS